MLVSGDSAIYGSFFFLDLGLEVVAIAGQNLWYCVGFCSFEQMGLLQLGYLQYVIRSLQLVSIN